MMQVYKQEKQGRTFYYAFQDNQPGPNINFHYLSFDNKTKKIIHFATNRQWPKHQFKVIQNQMATVDYSEYKAKLIQCLNANWPK